jgi:hypothetical protein
MTIGLVVIVEEARFCVFEKELTNWPATLRVCNKENKSK